MANTTLYDGSSASPDSRVFQLDGPVTVQAVGLAPDDVIYFEVIHLSKVSPSQLICGCYVYEIEKAQVDGIERLTCPTCESENEQFVRLTPRNTSVILDLPQGAFLRAYYEGSGLGTSRVWFATGADVKDLTPELRGCPPVCCEDRVWTATGERRCDPDADLVELQEVSNCGTLRWVTSGSVPWQDTGETRCTDTQVQKQQISPCGDVRWIDGEALKWTDTPNTRCESGQVQQEQTNQCGQTRWVSTTAVTWSDTGVTRCTDTHLQKQQVNPCGELQWVDSEVLSWSDTGSTRCTDTHVQVQQVNQCGQLRWSQGEALVWTDSGTERCKDGLVQLYQLNQCGEGRWINTARECVAPEYFATLPIPDGGLAYRPEDIRDPAATVEILTDCETPTVKGYLYPTPREGARTPVISGNCKDVCDDTVIGFAVDNPSCNNSCKCKDTVTVHMGDVTAVNYIETGSGRAYILWSDGSMTLTNLH